MPLDNEPSDLTPVTADDICRDLAVTEDQRDSSCVQDAVKELAEDPSLAALYHETFLDGRQELLKEKTKRQCEALECMALGEASTFHEGDVSGSVARSVERRSAEIRLSDFDAWIENMTPVRRDSNASLTEFKSPRILGVMDRAVMYDAPVQADAYVYCSFDGIRHNMAGLAQENVDPKDWDAAVEAGYLPGNEFDFRHGMPQAAALSLSIRPVDESQIKEKAEIVMMDAADAVYTAAKMGKGDMHTYLDNTFDYAGGKKILARYCAAVFDTPHEASEFLKRNVGRFAAEGWFKDPAYRDAHGTETGIKGMASFKDENGTPLCDLDPGHRLFAIQRKMLEVYRATGIVPPLQLEVRVRGTAKIKEGW